MDLVINSLSLVMIYSGQYPLSCNLVLSMFKFGLKTLDLLVASGNSLLVDLHLPEMVFDHNFLGDFLWSSSAMSLVRMGMSFTFLADLFVVLLILVVDLLVVLFKRLDHALSIDVFRIGLFCPDFEFLQGGFEGFSFFNAEISNAVG